MEKTTIMDKNGREVQTLFDYDGYRFGKYTPGLDPVEHLRNLATMEFQDTDVCVLSYPKSGTHWMYEAINMLRNGNSVLHSKIIPILDHMTIPYLKDAIRNGIFASHFYMRHLPVAFTEKKCKIIHVYRNPKDIAVSYFSFMKKLKVGEQMKEMCLEEYLTMYIDGNVTCGSWIDWMTQLQQFEKDNPDYPILNISFEEMKQDLKNCVHKVDAFLGLGSSLELILKIATKCDFKVISNFKHENLPPGTEKFATVLNQHVIYRKGDVGDWKNHFTVGQDETINKRLKEQIADLRLQIIYTL